MSSVLGRWWERYGKHNIKDVVKLEEWQKLRESLVGTWKNSPKENVDKLKKFLGDLSKTSDQKLRIVHNYLTGSGFRSQIISHTSITQLLKEVREEVERRKERVGRKG